MVSPGEVITKIVERIVTDEPIDRENVWFVSICPDADGWTLVVVNHAFHELRPGFYSHLIEERGWRFWRGFKRFKVIQRTMSFPQFWKLFLYRMASTDGPISIQYFDNNDEGDFHSGTIDLRTVDLPTP